MKIYYAYLLIVLVSISCNYSKTDGSQSNDSTELQEASLDSVGFTENAVPKDNKTNDHRYGFSVDSYLVDTNLDTSAFQLINSTCAIKIVETSKQISEREKQKAKEWDALQEKARKEWESQPHDSTEEFPGYYPEPEGYEGDDYYYEEKSKEVFDKLSIPVITAEPKNYVRLIGNDGKPYTIDVRSNFSLQWIILFQMNKSPICIDITSITEEEVYEYYFQK